MKKIKLIFAFMFVFTLSACGTNYTRDTSSGEIKQVTYAELREMYENEETFYAVFSQTTCGACNEFKENVLTPYTEDHNITIYEVNITNEVSAQATFDQLFKDYEEFKGTPHSTFVEEGKDKEQYVGEMSEEDFDDLVVKYELDKLEE